MNRRGTFTSVEAKSSFRHHGKWQYSHQWQLGQLGSQLAREGCVAQRETQTFCGFEALMFQEQQLMERSLTSVQLCGVGLGNSS